MQRFKRLHANGHNYARDMMSLYAMQQGLRVLTDEVVATNGEMARKVYAAREDAKVVTFDETNIFATKKSQTEVKNSHFWTF